MGRGSNRIAQPMYVRVPAHHGAGVFRDIVQPVSTCATKFNAFAGSLVRMFSVLVFASTLVFRANPARRVAPRFVGLLMAVFAVGFMPVSQAQALGDSPEERFIQRFEALCLMPVDEMAPSLVAGSLAVQHVSARAAEQGFLVNENLFTLADRAMLTPFALYLASKGDGLTIMHDLRAMAARIESQAHFTCMLSSKGIDADAIRQNLHDRIGVVVFDGGEVIYARSGKSHRVKIDHAPEVGVALVRHTALVDPDDKGAGQ